MRKEMYFTSLSYLRYTTVTCVLELYRTPVVWVGFLQSYRADKQGNRSWAKGSPVYWRWGLYYDLGGLPAPIVVLPWGPVNNCSTTGFLCLSSEQFKHFCRPTQVCRRYVWEFGDIYWLAGYGTKSLNFFFLRSSFFFLRLSSSASGNSNYGEHQSSINRLPIAVYYCAVVEWFYFFWFSSVMDFRCSLSMAHHWHLNQ